MKFFRLFYQMDNITQIFIDFITIIKAMLGEFYATTSEKYKSCFWEKFWFYAWERLVSQACEKLICLGKNDVPSLGQDEFLGQLRTIYCPNAIA